MTAVIALPIIALVGGFVVGGLPTADWLAARRGIDLRAAGSGNPGANNALRLGGRALGGQVLAVEMAKGAVCVLLGGLIGGDGGMVTAGLGAIGGNISSPYRGFRGGQGLGISAGVLLAGMPAGGAAAVAVAAGVALATRSSAVAALAAVAAMATTALWSPPAPWGLQQEGWNLLLALGIVALIVPKQIGKLRRPVRPSPPAPG